MEFFGISAPALLSQLLLGLVNGSFYAILSLGLAVIFGLLNVINFAHGALFMLGALLTWMGLEYLEVNYWVMLLLAPLIVGVLGVLIERFLLFRALLTGQRRLVINVSQHTAAVEGQGQGLLSHFLVARLLTEDIEPGIGAERIRHHWRPQSISYLLLRHTDTNFCYIVWCQIVTLVDVRTVNHSFQSGTACGQHKKNRCGSSQRFTAHSDLIPFRARAVRGSSVICR